MNGMVTGSSKSRSQRVEQFMPKKPSWPARDENNTIQQYHAVPLYLHCLGGNWDGQIEFLSTRSLEIRIQGMPPVQVGQELQFRCFGKTSDSLMQAQTGIIQQSHIQRGSTTWEGTTILLVELPGLHGAHKTSHDAQNYSFQLGSFVISQLTEGKEEDSYEIDPQTNEAPLVASTNKLLSHPSKCAYQKAQHIESSKMSIQNDSSHSIMAYHDYPLDTDLSTLPVVVLAPGYGETKRDYLTLAYYFANNGFHVIRYDHTNHVGESQGKHFNITLSSMKQDFQAMTQFAHQQWPGCPIIGVASSLASRVALKAEAEKPSLSLLVSLVGIVDVQQSVATVHQDDVFANYLNGMIQDSANIIGFNVGQQFLRDALSNNFSTLQTTLQDVQSLQTPIMYISAGKDAWIDKHALEKFKQSIDSHLSKWLDVPEALHRLQENPKIARKAYQQIIQHCHEHLDVHLKNSSIQDPNRADLGRQKRQEKMMLKQQLPTEVGQAFWSDYLGNFQTVGSCQDYVQLLDHVFHALGPITPGQQFLDAGCGNGNVGLFFLQSLQKRANQSQQISDSPIRYVGIDVIHQALGRAQSQMTQAYHAQQKSRTALLSPLQMSWSQVDLQYPLPFADNQFDRIVSNLVLGYIANPQAALQELFRVLAPGGRMVLSNLKPNGDFSGIYQSLVSQVGAREQKAEARELLNNYGKIRQAEKEGQFCFFDQPEWEKALDALNCVYAGVYPTFSNQAYLIVLEKPESFTQIPRLSTQKPHALLQHQNNLGNALMKAA